MVRLLVVAVLLLPTAVHAQDRPSRVTGGIVATGASLSLAEVSGREPTEAPSNQIGGHEAHGLLYRLSFASAVVAHGADLSTTAWCLGKATCVEANPALGWASDKPIPLAVSPLLHIYQVGEKSVDTAITESVKPLKYLPWLVLAAAGVYLYAKSAGGRAAMSRLRS